MDMTDETTDDTTELSLFGKTVVVLTPWTTLALVSAGLLIGPFTQQGIILQIVGALLLLFLLLSPYPLHPNPEKDLLLQALAAHVVDDEDQNTPADD